MIQNVGQVPKISDPSTLVPFAFVCDGEVAFIIKVPQENEHFLSVMQSNPTIVQFDDGNGVTMGDLYKDGKFVKP